MSGQQGNAAQRFLPHSYDEQLEQTWQQIVSYQSEARAGAEQASKMYASLEGTSPHLDEKTQKYDDMCTLTASIGVPFLHEHAETTALSTAHRVRPLHFSIFIVFLFVRAWSPLVDFYVD